MSTGPDDDVAKLYHEGAAEAPPAALDRAILKAARESAVPARKVRKPWWLRLALPLQLALSAVLVTMLALTVDRNPPEMPAVKERTQPQQAPAAAPPAAAPAAGELPAAPAASAAKARRQVPPESRASSPEAERKADAVSEAMPVPGRSDRAPAAKAEAGRLAAPSGARSQEAAAPGAGDAVPGVASSAVAPAANRAAAPRSPSDWLAAIERLAAAGEKIAARAELEAFHKAFPNYPVPERLEKLLAP